MLSKKTVYIVFFHFRLHATVLWERIILNSEMADAKTNFTLCCRKKSFGIGADGNVACITRQSDSYTGISTRFTSSPKTLHHFYLMLKCCLFQYVFFLWRVDYALEGSMFWLSNCKCDFSRLFHTERSWHAYWIFGWLQSEYELNVWLSKLS